CSGKRSVQGSEQDEQDEQASWPDECRLEEAGDDESADERPEAPEAEYGARGGGVVQGLESCWKCDVDDAEHAAGHRQDNDEGANAGRANRATTAGRVSRRAWPPVARYRLSCEEKRRRREERCGHQQRRRCRPDGGDGKSKRRPQNEGQLERRRLGRVCGVEAGCIDEF